MLLIGYAKYVEQQADAPSNPPHPTPRERRNSDNNSTISSVKLPISVSQAV